LQLHAFGCTLLKKTLSVRIDPALHARVCNDSVGNAYIVEKAINQYYRSKEPNGKVYANSVYDPDIVDLLKDQLLDLKLTNSKLLDMIQEKDHIIALHNMSWLQKRKYLKGKKWL